MRVVRSVTVMQRQGREWGRAGVRVGFVPTMGYLHGGHAALMRRARREVGWAGKVVVSVYVNPTQFGPGEDFARYPRDARRDLRVCREAGVDLVFVPTSRGMYGAGDGDGFSTHVVEEALSVGMEGQSRPGHFRGVTTVVAKLFNIVLPGVAVFGAKDFQQAAVVKRMVRDLNFPVRVVVAPTEREPDGLAMSSRNRYLEGELRGQARVLWRAIREARAAVRGAGKPVPSARLRRRLQGLIEAMASASVDYIEFFEPDTLRPVREVGRGCHMALAVRVGTTRLIDNGAL